MSEKNTFFEATQAFNIDALMQYHQAIFNLLTETTQQITNLNSQLLNNLLTPSSEATLSNAGDVPLALKMTRKASINNMTNEYIDSIQQCVNTSMQQFFNINEWSERSAHVMQKMLGVKSTD